MIVINQITDPEHSTNPPVLLHDAQLFSSPVQVQRNQFLIQFYSYPDGETDVLLLHNPPFDSTYPLTIDPPSSTVFTARYILFSRPSSGQENNTFSLTSSTGQEILRVYEDSYDDANQHGTSESTMVTIMPASRITFDFS